MTLDEAIQHCLEMADCTNCGREHLQLASWLTELKQLREVTNMEEKHGRWIKEPGEWHLNDEKRTPVNILKCSECGTPFQNAPYNYCPHCGVKMDKEGEE